MTDGILILLGVVVFVSALGIVCNALDVLWAWWERNR
jgi:hypothetical protein